MKRRYRAYSTYKDSGVEWLGKIPAHWDVRRLKFVSSIIYSNVDKRVKEDEIPVRQCNYVDVYKNDHIVNNLEFMEVTAKPEEIRKFLLRPGDIILTKDSEDWKDIAIPAFVPEPLDNVICGYHLALIRPSSPHIDPNYLFRSFQAAPINYQFQIEASGITRYSLGKRALGDALIVLPPFLEQRAIAAFLDRETTRIDALIAHKRELIDLLRRQRTALISHAVTKGLNPSAPLKDSGVEWLGEVPAHWEPHRLKFALERNDSGVWGEDLQENDFDDGEMGVIVLRSTEINLDGSWNLTNPARRKLTGGELRKSLLRAGDILITKSSGSEQHLGKSALVTKDIETLRCVFSNFMQRIRVLPAYDSKYIFYLLNCDIGKEQLGYWGSTTTGLRNLNASIIGETYLPGPPLPEQRAIAAFLDRETTRIDALIAKIEESIALLQQQRAALISAAVTGKIDVREQG